jgi:dTDP-4-dehydrorhamnose 3,5-epimerase/reductase
VNEYWSAELKDQYTFVNLSDPELNIPWPIQTKDMITSEADQNHPMLSSVNPMVVV